MSDRAGSAEWRSVRCNLEASQDFVNVLGLVEIDAALGPVTGDAKTKAMFGLAQVRHGKAFAHSVDETIGALVACIDKVVDHGAAKFPARRRAVLAGSVLVEEAWVDDALEHTNLRGKEIVTNGGEENLGRRGQSIK